jgi:hypothetical protein
VQPESRDRFEPDGNVHPPDIADGRRGRHHNNMPGIISGACVSADLGCGRRTSHWLDESHPYEQMMTA